MVSYVVFCIVFFKYSLYRPPLFDAILSEKSGRGFSRFYFRGIKASAKESSVVTAPKILPGLMVYTAVITCAKLLHAY